MRYDWVGKVIHRELCKKLNFDFTINSKGTISPHNIPGILRNKRFTGSRLEYQTKRYLTKQNYRQVYFTVPVDQRVKMKKITKHTQILGPCPRTKKTVKLYLVGLEQSSKAGKRDLKKRKSEEELKPFKLFRLRRLPVTQTLVEDYQSRYLRKTFKE